MMQFKDGQWVLFDDIISAETGADRGGRFVAFKNSRAKPSRWRGFKLQILRHGRVKPGMTGFAKSLRSPKLVPK
jgi:hypothetical protein